MDEAVVVISDVHLGQGDDFDIFAGPGKLDMFRDFMKHTAACAKSVEVVINGDFIDFLQVKPWEIKVDRAAAGKKVEKIVDAHKAGVLRALGELLSSPEHKLTILLGNHDVDLAFPEVWKHVADMILAAAGRPADGRLSFLALDKTRVTYLRQVGGVTVHIEHGNEDDPYNGMNYADFFRDAERGTSDFHYPPGTQLVYEIMNGHKENYRFVDLLKPEVPAVPLLLLALEPGAVVDVPGIGLKSLAALGNGFVGWLRSKISGPVLGRAGEPVSAEAADEDQLSRDMAAAYQDEHAATSGVTDADALLFARYFESTEEEPAAEVPVLRPSFAGAKKRLARAAVGCLGRPLGLRDRAYYQCDHPEREDVKWARKRLQGDVKVVVFGHTHRPLKAEFDDGRVYLNSGAWANQITLPGPQDDIEAWMGRIRCNDESNRTAFPTYITLFPNGSGVTAMLNLWDGKEETLWQKNIPA